MKILFISAILSRDYSELDIATTYLATFINERTDHDAVIIDTTFQYHRWRKFLFNKITDYQPDWIGISCTNLNMNNVITIMNHIRTFSETPIICGGYHTSISPEKVIRLPQVTALCRGDGEFLLKNLLDTWAADKSKLDTIPGLWIKKDNTIIKNGPGNFIKDIDALPYPNWDLWEDINKYLYYTGMLYFCRGRGCPFNCTYCGACDIKNKAQGSYYRECNPVEYANIIKLQWDKYKHRDFRLAQLFDQVPTMNIEWLEKFTCEYIRLGLNKILPYSMYSRIDHIDDEKIKILSESNCALLRVGIEAGNEHIRNDIYKKNISNERIKYVFKKCKEMGIGFTAYFILGGPDEDIKTMQDSLDLAREIKGNRTTWFIFKPLTEESHNLLTQYGGTYLTAKENKVHSIYFKSLVSSPKLKPWQVQLFQIKAYFLTFGYRLLKMILEQKHKYFIRLLIYLCKGLKDRLSPLFLFMYYHIYGYDNVKK